MKIESVSIEKLIKDPVNARKHNEKNIEAIKGSLAKFGQQKPIVVNKDNVVVAGNGTLEAARQLGWKEINVVRTELTGTDITAFGLADNRTSELAEWDLDVLPELLASLQELDFDLSSIGFDADDLNKLIPEEVEPGLTDDDAVPENVETRCKPGDLWILGNHRLLCGDSTNVQHVERLMNGEKADMVFTDPPYGVSFVGLKGTMYTNGVKKGKNSAEMIENDDLNGDDLISLFRESISLSIGYLHSEAPLYIFFGINKSLEVISALNDCHISIRNWLIWDKGNVGFHAVGAQYKPNYECFLYCHLKNNSPSWFGDPQQQTIWRHSIERLGMHPTMKPVSLIEQAVNNHLPKLVYDPFLGSGSTLIACEKTGRKCYACEIDPHYVTVAVKRWMDFTGKMAYLELEDGSKKPFSEC